MLVLTHFLMPSGRTDLPPLTRPVGVRVEIVPQRQPGANSLSCYADDADYTPVAIVR